MFSNTAIRLLRACLFVSALAVAGTGSAPVFAASPYDGSWSVVITTQVGACEPTVRYGLQIVDGAIIAASGAVADVSGRVTPRGFLNVSVRSGNAWAAGSGRLTKQTGSGSWRGEGSSGACQGSWVAERTGGPGEAANPGAPVYNYAPGAADER